MKMLGVTDIGNVREENEDSFLFFSHEGAAFLMVADGMGGHNGGKRASSLACSVIEKRIKEEYKEAFSEKKTEILMREALNEANSVIWHHSVKEIENRGMGTTVVLACIKDESYIIINLGDSRAYMIENDKITQLTKDQSYVQSLVDKGEITKEEAKDYPGKSIILEALGLGGQVSPDVYKGKVEGKILLCSDGLSNEVSDEKILEIINKDEESLEKLIFEAKQNGGKDNITIVLYEGA